VPAEENVSPDYFRKPARVSIRDTFRLVGGVDTAIEHANGVHVDGFRMNVSSAIPHGRNFLRRILLGAGLGLSSSPLAKLREEVFLVTKKKCL